MQLITLTQCEWYIPWWDITLCYKKKCTALKNTKKHKKTSKKLSSLLPSPTVVAHQWLSDNHAVKTSRDLKIYLCVLRIFPGVPIQSRAGEKRAYNTSVCASYIVPRHNQNIGDPTAAGFTFGPHRVSRILEYSSESASDTQIVNNTCRRAFCCSLRL